MWTVLQKFSDYGASNVASGLWFWLSGMYLMSGYAIHTPRMAIFLNSMCSAESAALCISLLSMIQYAREKTQDDM